MTLKEVRKKAFANGIVYAMRTRDGYPIEVTDTHLPYYTKHAAARGNNLTAGGKYGDRSERYMIGVSCMSGCPIKCKFCSTGKLPLWRNLSAKEIVEQVEFVVAKNPKSNPLSSREFKINYTRMGEPFLNIDNVREAIDIINFRYPNAHHYISTIGVRGSDFSFIKDNITLQISLHSLNPERRDLLIPKNGKMSIEELGKIRTKSRLKTTVNLTLVDEEDFDVGELKKYFDPEKFFIKLSPINPNSVSDKNGMGNGVIQGVTIHD